MVEASAEEAWEAWVVSVPAAEAWLAWAVLVPALEASVALVSVRVCHRFRRQFL